MNRRFTYQFPFAKYPAVRLALLLSAGIAVAACISLPDFLFLGMMVSMLLCYALFEYLGSKRIAPVYTRAATLSFLASVFLFGGFWYQANQHERETNIGDIFETFEWEQVIASGEIIDTGESASGNLRWDVRVDSTVFGDSVLFTQTYKFRALVDPDEIDIAKPVIPAQRVSFTATVYPLEGPRNPHEFDYRSYLKSLDIVAQAGIDSLIRIESGSSSWSWHRVRGHVLKLINQNFSEETAPLAKGLLIGYKNELTPEEKLSFSRTGLSHIMAVSGLHVGFIVAPFWFMIPFFWTFRYGKQLGLILLLLLLLGYAGITGFSASVSRASLMAGFLAYGRLFHKVRDSINLMATAALILLLINPSDLFDVGFQLSFSAVLLILLILPVFQNALPDRIRFRWYNFLILTVLVSFIVQIGLYPLLGFYFGEFSLIGPAANALVVPFLGIMVPFALALLPVTAAFPVTGQFLNYPNEVFLRYLNLFVDYASSMEYAWISTQVDSVFIFLLWISGAALVASLYTPALRWKMLIVFLSLLVAKQVSNLIEKQKPPELTVTVFDVGQGDAALVTTPARQHFLIDTGRWTPGYNSARSVILPHLKAEGIEKLDAIFLSHPHADHIGGVVELIEEIPVDTIYDSGYSYDSRLYEAYRDAAEENSVPVRAVTAGTAIQPDSLLLFMIYAPDDQQKGDDPNDQSIVMELVFGHTEFLFTGDTEVAGERAVVQKYHPLIDAQFLKVGHHGSKTSSTSSFLSAVNPEIAVASLAKSNRFQHPHQEAVRRLKDSSAALYFTSLDKALIFTSNGRKIEKKEWQ